MGLPIAFLAPFHFQITMGESRPQNMLTHSPTSHKACCVPLPHAPAISYYSAEDAIWLDMQLFYVRQQIPNGSCQSTGWTRVPLNVWFRTHPELSHRQQQRQQDDNITMSLTIIIIYHLLHVARICVLYSAFGFRLTVSWNIELDEIFKVLYVRRQATNFIVTQAQFSQAMQSEEILQVEEEKWRNLGLVLPHDTMQNVSFLSGKKKKKKTKGNRFKPLSQFISNEVVSSLSWS